MDTSVYWRPETDTPVHYLGYTLGATCIYDMTSAPAMLPARLALFYYNEGVGYSESGAWDLQAALYAVRGLTYGATDYFALSAAGKNTVDASGNNTFTVGAGAQYYLSYAGGMDDAAMEAILEGLLFVSPYFNVANIYTLNGNVGIGTRAPGRPLEVNAVDGYGFRVTYNDADGSPANYLDIFVGSTGTAYISGSSGKFATANAICPSHAIDVTQAGQTAGTIYCNQIFQGTKYKKALIYCNGFNGSYDWTYPTAFTIAPHVTNGATGLQIASYTTHILLDADGSARTGWVTVEGY